MLLLSMATKPKVIKISELKKIKASIRKNFKKQWGFDVFSQQCINHGSHESEGGDVYDDTMATLASIHTINGLIKQCRQL